MNRRPNAPPIRILALHPTTGRLGYAVFEGPRQPVDWGTKRVQEAENTLTLSGGWGLMGRYAPDFVVLEDPKGPASRRGKRMTQLLEALGSLAEERGILTRTYSRGQLRDCFARFDAQKKDAITRAIALQIPEFVPRLPRMRRPWMSEDHRMAIFDATALVFTFFYFEGLEKEDPPKPG